VKSIPSVLLWLILITFLTSCSSVKKLEVQTVEVKRAPLNLENPEPIVMEELNWYIINSENAEEVFAKLKEQNKDPVLFGLSDDDYEILAKNFAHIRAHIIKQQLILDKYRDYYEGEEDGEKN